MSYTILSAKYANAEHTAVEAMTVESKSVILSAADTPKEWDALLKWGTPVSYVAKTPMLVIDVLSKLVDLQAQIDVLKTSKV